MRAEQPFTREKSTFQSILNLAFPMKLCGGLTPRVLPDSESGFEAFVANTPADNLKAEYLLPTIIGDPFGGEKACSKSADIKR